MKWIERCLFFAALLAVACDSSPDRETGVRRDASTRDAPSGDVATADSGAEDGGTGDAGNEDAGPSISIPDPGTAMDDWGNSVNNVCCSTPDTAYPVGVVTMNSGYVQGNIDATTGDFFYVFRAGPALTQLTWSGAVGGLDVLDLHDGAGMVFGAVIPPINSGPNTGTWTVTPNQVYVLHLHSTAPGFF